MRPNGMRTIVDVGIAHPLVGTYVTMQSSEERGFAANKYAARKDKDYNAIIQKKKDLDNKNSSYKTSTSTVHWYSVRTGRLGN